MKNKFFELYKPKQLLEFLAFIKENPKEEIVYVLQQPATESRMIRNRHTGESFEKKPPSILSASDFGYLAFCLPESSQMIFSPTPFIHKMRKNLRDFKGTDYILCMGDPAIIGLSTAVVSDVTNGKFNLLKWDRQERRYYPLTFDLYAKGELE
jgi:hypothetical protein|tara:strand:- start:41 stop:499 length:459 start_codon:yes stop_codon:yes gene_type:complete